MKDTIQEKYSESDLKEFKEIILKKLKQAEDDFNFYQSLYQNGKDNGTDDTLVNFKSFDGGSDVQSREQNNQLATRAEKFVRDLKNALARIENGTYGICRVTGKLIEKPRLKIVPHATLSIEAKRKMAS